MVFAPWPVNKDCFSKLGTASAFAVVYHTAPQTCMLLLALLAFPFSPLCITLLITLLR